MSEESIAPDITTCPMCGATVAAADRKCGVCGENLTDTQTPGGESGDALTEKEIRVFVGRHADYYLTRWHRALAGVRKGAGFNWAAFLLAGLWFPYRKMYVAAAIFYGIILAESIVEEVGFMVILGEAPEGLGIEWWDGLITAFVCGVYGNRWYLTRCRKVVADLKSQGMPEGAYLQSLSRRGGTNIAASLGFFVLFMVVLFAVFFAWEMMIPSG